MNFSYSFCTCEISSLGLERRRKNINMQLTDYYYFFFSKVPTLSSSDFVPFIFLGFLVLRRLFIVSSDTSQAASTNVISIVFPHVVSIVHTLPLFKHLFFVSIYCLS